MDFKKLTDKAKDVVEKRGSSDALKRDAEKLKGIARGEGSISDKARAAVSAIKDPGAEEEASPAAKASPEERERAEEKVEHEHHGKYAHPEEMHEQN